MIFKKGSAYMLHEENSMLARLHGGPAHFLTISKNLSILLFLFEKAIPGVYNGTSPNAEPMFEVYFLVGDYIISMPRSVAEDALIEIKRTKP